MSVSGRGVSGFGLALAEDEETLTDIVQSNKQTHGHQHGNVVLDGLGAVGKDMPHKRLGHAVSQQIAQGNVDHKTGQGFRCGSLVLKGECAVEEIAEDTSEEIIGCGGDPIAKMKHIVEQEHDPGSKQRIEYAHQDEFPEGMVKGSFEQLFHVRSLHRFL